MQAIRDVKSYFIKIENDDKALRIEMKILKDELLLERIVRAPFCITR